MRNKIIYILSLAFFQVAVYSQVDVQEEYLNSNPSKQEFNKNHWKKIKKTMLREARGNAKAKGDDFNRSDFEDNNQNASYYEYQEESFDGEYAKNNGERKSDYTYEEENIDYNKGDGDNFSNYESRDHDEKTGEYYSKDRSQSEKSNSSKKNRNSSYNGGGLGTFGSILLYTLLAVFLGFIIYILFVNTTISEEGRSFKEVELERAPVEISKTELELMLEKALTNDDFRLAIRIYFIFILKDLSEKSWINWKKEKTNISYLMEMRGKKQYESFNESVSIFELVWYGNYTITNKDYSSIEPKFIQLLKELAES